MFQEARILLAVFLFAIGRISASVLADTPGASQFVTTPDGMRIHCLVRGAGPSLLFVPGWTIPAEVWQHQITHFSRSNRVVAMDPRAQGRSSQTGEGLFPAARARDIKAVVDHLRLAPVVLVGWSMGVAEVVSYIDQFGTSDLDGIVLVDGNAGIDLDSEMALGMLKFAGELQKRRLELTPVVIQGMFRHQANQEFIKQMTDASLKMPTSAALALVLGSLTADLRPVLPKIDRPALVAVTADEPWVQVYRDMAARIPKARLELFPDAGHALFVDEPDKFNRLLSEFLSIVRGNGSRVAPK